jgi:hypothetical protein
MIFAYSRLIERRIVDFPVPLIPKKTVLFPSSAILADSIALKFSNSIYSNRTSYLLLGTPFQSDFHHTF